MFTSIRHIAVLTENWDREAKFYQTIFGMKKITNGMTDEKGEYNKDRGHLSDGVIGLALLQRQPGSRSGLDHFGFAVESVQVVRDRIKQSYPDIYIHESQSHVPFAGLRGHDPDGNQYDLSQKGMANVREGYVEFGWDTRGLSLFIRTAARRYRRVLSEVSISNRSRECPRQQLLSHDGKGGPRSGPYMIQYRGHMAGLDTSVQGDDLERTKRILALAASAPTSRTENRIGREVKRQKISKVASSEARSPIPTRAVGFDGLDRPTGGR